jgi:hypothetical protein
VSSSGAGSAPGVCGDVEASLSDRIAIVVLSPGRAWRRASTGLTSGSCRLPIACISSQSSALARGPPAKVVACSRVRGARREPCVTATVTAAPLRETCTSKQSSLLSGWWQLVRKWLTVLKLAGVRCAPAYSAIVPRLVPPAPLASLWNAR